MATYVRQSAGSIIPGADITSAPLNSEFNQLELAFGTGGHTHTGVAGDAPKISLTNSIAGYLPVAHGGTGGLNNFAATLAPSSANDTSSGYAIGSLWFNSNTNKIYICTDSTQSAAVWKEIGLSTLTGAVALGDITATSFNGIVGNVTPAAGTFTSIASTGGATATFPIVNISGGSIDGVTIGANTQGDITGNLITANTNFAGNITGNVTGNVEGIVGGNTPAAGSFTGITITSSGNIDLGNTTGAGAGTVTNLKTPSSDYDAATKKYVDDVVGGAPAALDTLNELAAAINDDSTFHTTVTNALGARIKTDGTNAMAASLDLNSNRIINLADPIIGQDATTQSWVNSYFVNNSTTNDQSLASNLNLAATKEITVQLDPSTGDALARKSYVDGILINGQNAETFKNDAQKLAIQPHNSQFTLSTASSSLQGYSALHYYTETYNLTQTAGWGNVSSAATSIITLGTGYDGTTATSGTNTNIANINTVATANNNINIVANDINNINTFAETYFIRPATNFPSSPTAGDLLFDTTNNALKVYEPGNGWQSIGTSVNAIEQSEEFIVGTDKTANNGVQYDGDSGTNANWNNTFPCTYTSGATTAESQVHVYLNGTKLAHSEYTATNGSTIVLGSNASASDVVHIVAFGSFAIGNVYTKSEADTTFMPKAGGVFAGTVTIPDLVVTGTTTSVNTTNINISDNIIVLNNGEQGSVVTNNTAGFHIDRGSGTNASLIFDDTDDDSWKAGLVGSEGKIALSNKEFKHGTAVSSSNNVDFMVGGIQDKVFQCVNGATGYGSNNQTTNAVSCPLDQGTWVQIVSNGSHTITFSNGNSSGFCRTFTLQIVNTSNGATPTYAFSNPISWAGGTAPAFPGNGTTSIYTFTHMEDPTNPGGTKIYGAIAMANIPN